MATAVYRFNGPNSAGGFTTVNGIANGGPAVGVSIDGGGNVTNFVRHPNGTFTTLNINATTPMANGINNQGSVVGGAGTTAFLLAGGSTSTLPPPNPNTQSQIAFGINDRGAIVGQYADGSTGTTPGFLYANGSYTTLNPVSPVGGVLVVNAQGINNNGLVAGFYSTATTPVIDANTPQHGFFYDSQMKKLRLLADPNLPNFFLIQLLGINDNDIAAGYWQDTAGNQHGLLYNLASGTYNFFDDPAQGIENGISITQITGIDNANQLSGFYVGTDGIQHGFVASPVPEPAALATASLGLFGLLVVLRRKMNPRSPLFAILALALVASAASANSLYRINVTGNFTAGGTLQDFTNRGLPADTIDLTGLPVSFSLTFDLGAAPADVFAAGDPNTNNNRSSSAPFFVTGAADISSAVNRLQALGNPADVPVPKVLQLVPLPGGTLSNIDQALLFSLVRVPGPTWRLGTFIAPRSSAAAKSRAESRRWSVSSVRSKRLVPTPQNRRLPTAAESVRPPQTLFRGDRLCR